MIRKIRSQSYRLKATYIENDKSYTFYCKENRLQNLTNELGMSIPLANGNRTLETRSKLEFKLEHMIVIGGVESAIESVTSSIDTKDLNSLRGAPTYIKTITIR
jgi:hypothetical protein